MSFPFSKRVLFSSLLLSASPFFSPEIRFDPPPPPPSHSIAQSSFVLMIFLVLPIFEHFSGTFSQHTESPFCLSAEGLSLFQKTQMRRRYLSLFSPSPHGKTSCARFSPPLVIIGNSLFESLMENNGLTPPFFLFKE